MSKPLPLQPSLEHLRKQAKNLLRSFQAGEPEATNRFRDNLPKKLQNASVRLSDAQSVLAREYGFVSWTALKEHVEELAIVAVPGQPVINHFLTAACGDTYARPNLARAERLLAEHPEIMQSAHAAAAAGNLESLRPHLGSLSPAGPKKAHPIVYACFSGLLKSVRRKGVLDCVRIMLEHGVDPNTAYVPEGMPANPLSCLYGATGWLNDPELARILLEAGAAANDGESLYHSTEHRDHACLRLLIQYGASFKATNALPHMLDYEDPEGIRICLEAGADVNEPPPSLSALHHAILRGRSVRIIAELLRCGARLDLRDKHNRTPLMLARRLGLTEIIGLLQQSGAPEDPLDQRGTFLAACAAADEQQARAILQREPDLLSRLEPEDLHILPDQAELGRYASVQLLLELGFPVAVKGNWQASALNQAASRGDTRMVRLLLDHGARWDEKNGYGGDAFGSAIWPYLHDRAPDADYLGVIRLLLESGGEIPDDEIEDEPLLELLDEFRPAAI